MRIALFALALPGLLAGQGFEGRITAEMSRGDDEPAAPVVILTKGAKTRMDMTANGMPMYMIMDSDAQTVTSVIPSQRMFMRMDLNMAGMANDASEPAPKITRTGRRETIAGHACEHVLFDTPDGDQMDICAARGLGFFMSGRGGPFGGGAVPAGYEQLMKEFKEGFFPLRIETVEDGKRTTMMLVKTIETQKLAATEFEPPAGFQEMKMPGMPGRP
jgi:hypothetical protein